MKNLIAIGRGMSTLGILRRELDNIEHATGVRPDDWLSDIYDEAYEEFMTDEGFDWEGFEMHLSCTADSFIEFFVAHYQHLNNNLYSPS
jgi:hypothetical protein